MKPGSVVLVRMPGTAGGAGKLRPALVVAGLPGPYQDVLVCGISTRFSDLVPKWDDTVGAEDPDFLSSGLHRPSAIRLSYLTAVESSAVAGRIGQIDAARLERVVGRLAALLSGASTMD